MLVLSRKVNQKIKIGNDITITVVKLQGDRVGIGIEAPREVPVNRLEVYEAIRRKENPDVVFAG